MNSKNSSNSGGKSVEPCFETIDEKSSSVVIDANEIPNNDLEILIKMEHANRFINFI